MLPKFYFSELLSNFGVSNSFFSFLSKILQVLLREGEEMKVRDFPQFYLVFSMSLNFVQRIVQEQCAKVFSSFVSPSHPGLPICVCTLTTHQKNNNLNQGSFHVLFTNVQECIRISPKFFETEIHVEWNTGIQTKKKKIKGTE